MAQMLEDLQLEPGQRVLESARAPATTRPCWRTSTGGVVSLDVDRRGAGRGGGAPAALPDRRVELRPRRRPAGLADGCARSTASMVTAATPDLEPAWLEQLADGGLVQAPLELAPGLAFMVQGKVQWRQLSRGG